MIFSKFTNSVCNYQKTIWAQPIKNIKKNETNETKQQLIITGGLKKLKKKKTTTKTKKTITHKTGPGLTGPSQSPAPKQHSLSVQLQKDAVEDVLLPYENFPIYGMQLNIFDVLLPNGSV